MVFRRRALKKRVPRRALINRKKAAARRRMTNVPDIASCSVSFNVADPRTNQPYNYETFRLTDSQRAVAIAKGYQLYRIVNVRMTWKPLYDTYSSATANTKPVIYYIIDRGRNVQDTFTINQLKEMGCRPHNFDEKPVQVNFKPGVLLESDSNTALAAKVLYAPWLSTNGNTTVAGGAWVPSQVNHQGIKYFIETADGTPVPLQVTVEYQIQFKKPNWSSSSSSEAAMGMVVKAGEQEPPAA